MPGQPLPPLVVEAFAKNAAPSYIQNPIPVTTLDPERASFDLGFPPKTMTEILAGGTPPYGQDMNGILYMLSAHIAALQAGQPYLFSSTLASALSGYAVGCVLGMADGTGVWINTVNGNTTDPDGGSPAGWMPLYNHGFAAISGLTGGTRTLTPAEYRRNVIVLSGTLAGNLQVIVPNGTLGQRSWLVVNTTTGSFTTTVKTAAGSGVTVPQGGYSAPVEVYGDGTNVYPTVAPLSIPIDQNPTASSIAQRTNTGQLFATYFNSNNPIENFGMAAVYADAGDGYHRKISLANFAAQISLSQFAGQVANAQVPLSAIMQYAAQIWNSANLTGSSTAPTQAPGNSSALIATTAFANPGQSQAANGYVKLPGGVIIQWGVTAALGGGSANAITYPIAFTSAAYVTTVTAQNTGGTAQSADTVTNKTVNGFTLNNAGSVGRVFNWIAIGV